MSAIPPHPAHALLEAVDWSAVEHADGVATNLLPILRQLTVKQDQPAANAHLFALLFDDRVPTAAALAAVPYLLELIHQEVLAYPRVVVEILLYIAVINPSNYALEEYDTSVFWRDDPDEADWWQITCYEAVQAGVSMFRKRLKDTQCDDTRDACAYALAFFPTEAEGSIAVLLEQIPKLSNNHDLMDYFLYLELLARRSKVQYTFDELQPYTLHQHWGVRIIASILTAERPLTVEWAHQFFPLYLQAYEWGLDYEEFLEECDYDEYITYWLLHSSLEEKQVLLRAGVQLLKPELPEEFVLYSYFFLMIKLLYYIHNKQPLKTIAWEDFSQEAQRVLRFLCQPIVWINNSPPLWTISRNLEYVGLPSTRETLSQHLAQA